MLLVNENTASTLYLKESIFLSDTIMLHKHSKKMTVLWLYTPNELKHIFS